jgi:hypothetical protein
MFLKEPLIFWESKQGLFKKGNVITGFDIVIGTLFFK